MKSLRARLKITTIALATVIAIACPEMGWGDQVSVAPIVQTIGTWTPTDASGAGLTLTEHNGGYTQIGNMVHAYAEITYPSTASGSNALIGGLPVTVANSTYARQCFVTSNGSAQNISLIPQVNSTQMSIATLPGAVSVTNLTLSTVQLRFECIYPAS